MPRLLPLALVALLAGCGQKGPLYLPVAPAATPLPPAAAAPSPDAGAANESEVRERATPAAQP